MKKPKKGRPPGKGRRWWKDLTTEERFAAIAPYFANEIEWPNHAIQRELGLSVGTVAGIKRRWKEKQAATAKRSHPVTPRLAEIPTVASEKLEHGGAGVSFTSDPVRARVTHERRKIAASEEMGCSYVGPDRKRCPYEPSGEPPDPDRCTLHVRVR